MPLACIPEHSICFVSIPALGYSAEVILLPLLAPFQQGYRNYFLKSVQKKLFSALSAR
jgi:hypothetical protein